LPDGSIGFHARCHRIGINTIRPCYTGVASDAGVDAKLVGFLGRPVRTLHSDLRLPGRDDADRGFLVWIGASPKENYKE
jgi:hypothetical protein